jgi:ferredoxin-NADP reductase
MAEKRVGTISAWTDVVPGLAVFRLKSAPGTQFPEYRAGQYIALTREHCKLTNKVKDADGHIRYEPAFNDDGTPKTRAVTHSYSIASAPFETQDRGEIEIYITLEKLGHGQFGRFTESLFGADPHVGDNLGYMDRIVGNFTLDQRAPAVPHVVMVGTGTGLAPFVGMMKQAAHEAKAAPSQAAVKYTLIHANRTATELGYDAELLALAARSIPGFDFGYVRSVSRPTAEDAADPLLSLGRANNLFRSIVGLPTREQEVLDEARVQGAHVVASQHALDKSTKPRLGSGVDGAAIAARMPRGETTVLTCGNADLMEDIRRICERAGFKFEMEEW